MLLSLQFRELFVLLSSCNSYAGTVIVTTVEPLYCGYLGDLVEYPV